MLAWKDASIVGCTYNGLGPKDVGPKELLPDPYLRILLIRGSHVLLNASRFLPDLTRLYCYNSPVISNFAEIDMRYRSLLPLLLTIIPGVALTQDITNYRCTQGDMTRRVEIVYEPGVAVPCEVHYYKDTEAPGQQQRLWRSLNEEGYCEAMTKEFIGKLTGWGWSCAAADANAAAPEEQAEEAVDEPADDSDVLAPGEPEDEEENQ